MTYKEASAIMLRPGRYSSGEYAEARQVYREGTTPAARQRRFIATAQRHRLRLTALDAILIGLLVLALLVV